MEYNEVFGELNQTTDEVVENETVEETTEEITEVAENTEEEYAPEFSELAEEIEETTKPKKKFPIQVPIIIAACIVVIALIAYFAVNLFVPTVEGSWAYETDDGTVFYYTFDEKADANECEMSIGSIHFPGTYDLSVTDDTKTVTISIYAGYIYGSYDYAVTGNRLMKNRVMTLAGEDGTTITLTEAKAPKDSDYITPDEDFVPVESIVGEWEYLYEEYDSSLKLTINDDGTMVYNQFDYQELHCVYTADESIINLSFYETELISQEEEYYFDNGQLIFLGLNWTRVGESTADQA